MIAHSAGDQSRLIDRAAATWTHATEAMLRATDEISLMNEICRVAVDIGGYRLAWVGLAEAREGQTVRPLAMAGKAKSYMDNCVVTWSDGPTGQGPTGKAIRNGKPVKVDDTETDPGFTAWRDRARRHKLRSAAAFPLEMDGRKLGALTVYAGDPNAFDRDVMRMMESLAWNLSYGISALRVKAEHDKAVRDLAESEERYRSLIELTPDAILVHHRGRILYANHAAARAFATSEDDLVDRQLIEMFTPDFHTVVSKRILSPPRKRLVDEYRMRRMDGSEFDVEIAATSINFHGAPARILAIRDITERKQVEAQLIQTAKLATLGEMAAGLVHELSQPLNVMRLTAEGALLFIERGKATPDWQAQQFQLIADQAQRTAEIIEDIRVFSRRDTSPVQVFDTAAAMASAMGVLEGQLRSDDITLAYQPPAKPILIKGRRSQLEQVVINLLSNAQHALKEKRDSLDPIEAQAWRAEITVAAQRRGRNLLITVSDNGPGIPVELRPRIFEPFFTTKSAGRGTGLGLSVSFGIINNMNGRLTIQDQPVGAGFTITLPLAEEDAAAQNTAEGSNVCVTALDSHILVVEDNAAAAESLANALVAMGCRVSTCSSGTEAWQRFMSEPADVVITDLHMPAGGGEQLIARLRDYDPLLPIVVTTGHLGASEQLDDTLNDDRCVVLKKPLPLGQLAEIIATFLQPPS